MKIKNVINTLGLPAIATAVALAGAVSTAHADGFEMDTSNWDGFSAHAALSMYDVDGFDDNGTMVVFGGGYAIHDRLQVKADYGLSLQDAENTQTITSGFDTSSTFTQELDLSQLRAYAQTDRYFGDTNFGGEVRLGIARLDGDVTVSDDDGSSDSGSVDNTGLMWGLGLFYEFDEQQKVYAGFDSPSSDVNTFEAGYEYRF